MLGKWGAYPLLHLLTFFAFYEPNYVQVFNAFIIDIVRIILFVVHYFLACASGQTNKVTIIFLFSNKLFFSFSHSINYYNINVINLYIVRINNIQTFR